MTLLRRTPRRSGPLRVLFVVPDLGVGGAERHVATLAPALELIVIGIATAQQGAVIHKINSQPRFIATSPFVYAFAAFV